MSSRARHVRDNDDEDEDEEEEEEFFNHYKNDLERHAHEEEVVIRRENYSTTFRHK